MPKLTEVQKNLKPPSLSGPEGVAALNNQLCLSGTPGPLCPGARGPQSHRRLSSQRGSAFFLILGIWKVIPLPFLLLRKQQSRAPPGSSLPCPQQAQQGGFLPLPLIAMTCCPASFPPVPAGGLAEWQSVGMLLRAPGADRQRQGQAVTSSVPVPDLDALTQRLAVWRCFGAKQSSGTCRTLLPWAPGCCCSGKDARSPEVRMGWHRGRDEDRGHRPRLRDTGNL